MRRQAWKQCRSCSARLGFDMAATRSRGTALAGWIALAASLEHRGDRMLREPVDLRSGMERAQLTGDRDVAPRVAEPDRRGDEQRPLRRPRRGPRRAGGGGGEGATKSWRSRLTVPGRARAARARTPSSVDERLPMRSSAASRPAL